MNIQTGDWVMMKDGQRVKVESVMAEGVFLGATLVNDNLVSFYVADVEEICWD